MPVELGDELYRFVNGAIFLQVGGGMGYCLGFHLFLEFFSEGICDKLLNYSARQDLLNGLSDDKQTPGKIQRISECSGTKRRACNSYSVIVSDFFLQNHSDFV